MEPRSRSFDLGPPVRPAAPASPTLRRAAVLLCLIPAAYLLATVAYALLNAGEFASDLPRLLRYVVVPALIGVALLLAGVRLPRAIALNVGIVAVSVLATLFLFETWLTLRLLPRQGNVVGVVDAEVGLDAYRMNLPPAYTIKALNAELGVTELSRARLSAVPDQPVMLCSMDGQPITYRADAYGFRNPPGTDHAAARIMVLGDSFVEGLCLPDGAGVIGQLRGRVTGPVVNTGSRGAGPLFELAVLGRYGPVFRPPVTLMAFFEGNDWENLQNETQASWLAGAMDPHADFGPPGWTAADLQDAGSVISGWWAQGAASVEELFRRQSMLRNYLALANTAQVLGLHYPKAMAPNPDYAPLLDRAAGIAQGWGGRLVIVYIPAHDRFAGLFPHDFVSEDLRRMVHDAAAGAGLAVIDLTEAFARHPDPTSLYAPDSHFSTAGAVLAADEIAAGLARLPQP